MVEPIEIYSPGTMVLQWGLAALVLIIFNDRIAKAIKGHHTGIEGERIVNAGVYYQLRSRDRLKGGHLLH